MIHHDEDASLFYRDGYSPRAQLLRASDDISNGMEDAQARADAAVDDLVRKCGANDAVLSRSAALLTVAVAGASAGISDALDLIEEASRQQTRPSWWAPEVLG